MAGKINANNFQWYKIGQWIFGNQMDIYKKGINVLIKIVSLDYSK